MQTDVTPQNTINSEDRDASVQISKEAKSELIRRGLITKRIKDGMNFDTATHSAFGELCAFAEMLTSTNKHSREYAKRELRKIAKEGEDVTRDKFDEIIFQSFYNQSGAQP